MIPKLTRAEQARLDTYERVLLGTVDPAGVGRRVAELRDRILKERAMAAAKRQPRIGDECWIVEWVYQLAWVDGDSTSEHREVDRDNCKTRRRTVATKEDAERLAKEIWPQTHDAFGIVEYWQVRYEAYDDGDGSGPYLPHWEPVRAYGEIYEGEE